MNIVAVIEVDSSIAGNLIGVNLIVDISKRTACNFYYQPGVGQTVASLKLANSLPGAGSRQHEHV